MIFPDYIYIRTHLVLASNDTVPSLLRRVGGMRCTEVLWFRPAEKMTKWCDKFAENIGNFIREKLYDCIKKFV